MSIKTIMTPLSGAEESSAALDLAFDCAERFDARVTVVHPALDARATMPYLGEGMTGAMVEDVMEAVEREEETRSTRARRLFDEACARAASGKDRARFVSVPGREEDVIGERGRLADLIVDNRPENPEEVSGAHALHAAIVESGRPVLVAPRLPTVSWGRRIAVSWTGTLQAARATGFALPFLAKADEVVLLPFLPSEDWGPEVNEAQDYLGAHGIESRIGNIDGRSGEAVLAAAAAANCDMLVAGAYAHSRLRRLIFGGVTEHVLGAARVPLLMAH